MNSLYTDPAFLSQSDPAETPHFSPEGSLFGIVLDAVASSHGVRIDLPGKGNLRVFPQQQCYASHTSDMPGFCQAPATQFEIAKLTEREVAAAQSPNTTRPINELFWQTAFFASRGRLLRGAGADDLYPADIVSFKRWPNLTRLPTTPNTMRICALLTRHSSAIMLIPRRLGVSPEEVCQVVSAARASGIVQVKRGMAETHEPATPGDGHGTALAEPGLLRAMLSWLRAR